MKTTLGYELTRQLRESVFADHLMKGRIDLIRICVKTCRELTLSPPKEIDSIRDSKLVLKRDKMSRLFFFEDKKYVSVAVPFELSLKSDNTPQFHHNKKPITSEIWSKLIERLNYDDDGWMKIGYFHIPFPPTLHSGISKNYIDMFPRRNTDILDMMMI